MTNKKPSMTVVGLMGLATLLASSLAVAEPLALPTTVASKAPLDLRLPPSALLPIGPVDRDAPWRKSLSRSMASAAKVSLLEQGVEASRQALIDCQKGDYPGGGAGLLSMPFANASAQTDHCRRF